MRIFLEKDSAHYPELEVLVASEGQSRIELFNEGKQVDTIHVYRWNVKEVRKLMADLGMKRDETITWETKAKEAELASYFNNPPPPKKEEL